MLLKKQSRWRLNHILKFPSNSSPDVDPSVFMLRISALVQESSFWRFWEGILLCFYVGVRENGSQTELLFGKPGRPAYSSAEPINHVVKSQPRLLLELLAAVSWPQSAPREQTCYFPPILRGMTLHRRVPSHHLLRCHQDIRELRLRAATENNYKKRNN